MAEQKIVQHRRDIYSNYAPSKIKPGEIIMITSGDPNSSSGKGVYACVAAGDVMQLATLDELGAYDQEAQSSAEAAEQAKSDAATIKEQISQELTSAQSAAESAAGDKADIEQLKTDIELLKNSAQAAAEDAAESLQNVQEKETEIREILISNSRKFETGGNTTDANGEMYVYLSDSFKESLGDNPYWVFLQEEGEGKVYVGERTDTYFLVSGTPELKFSWMAVL